MDCQVVRVVNLSDETTEDTLKQLLVTHIPLNGKIESVFLNKDESLKLIFAYVVFQLASDARQVVQGLNKINYNNLILCVELIDPKLSYQIYNNPQKLSILERLERLGIRIPGMRPSAGAHIAFTRDSQYIPAGFKRPEFNVPIVRASPGRVAERSQTNTPIVRNLQRRTLNRAPFRRLQTNNTPPVLNSQRGINNRNLLGRRQTSSTHAFEENLISFDD